MINLTHDDIYHRTAELSKEITKYIEQENIHVDDEGKPQIVFIHGIPRGGIPVVYLLLRFMKYDVRITSNACEAHILVDDLIDSGATQARYLTKCGEKPFFALYEKGVNIDNEWIVFPWEEGDKNEDQSAEDIPIRLLQYIGEDVTREGLQETPHRFLKAWQFITQGYKQNPKDIMKVFEDGAEHCNYDEMVLIKNIDVYSVCEHHLLPFFGKAHVAYIPDGKIIGLSKIPRLIDLFSRRLQVQERLTGQIIDTLVDELSPRGVGVVLECKHMCVEMRGVQKCDSTTTTSAMRGVFLEPMNNSRTEFLRLIR